MTPDPKKVAARFIVHQRKSLQVCKTETLAQFQKLRRLQEADDEGNVTCVTCGKVGHYKNFDGGHYLKSKLHNSVAFHFQNVHPQCKFCNIWGGGCADQYRVFLGDEVASRLEEIAKQARRKGHEVTFDKWQLAEMFVAFKQQQQPELKRIGEC